MLSDMSSSCVVVVMVFLLIYVSILVSKILFKLKYFLSVVTLHNKTKYICSIMQQCMVWVKMINFFFMPNIIRIFCKDGVP